MKAFEASADGVRTRVVAGWVKSQFRTLASNSAGETSPRRLALALLLGVFAIGSEALVISPILADVAEAFDRDVDTTGLAVSAYGVSVGIMALLFGPLSDQLAARTSRHVLLVIALLVFIVGTTGCALAPNLAVLFGARVVAGAAAGAFIPAAYAFVADKVAYESRGRIMGLVMSGWAAAMVLGVPLGGLVGQALSWRWAFALLSGVALLGVAAIARVRVSGPDAVTGAAASAIPEQPENSTQRAPWRQALTGTLSAARVPGVTRLLGVTLCNMFGFYGVYTYVSSFFRESLGLGSAGAGALILAYGIGLATEPLTGRLADRVGVGKVLRAALLGLVGVLVLLPTGATTLFALLPVLAVWGALQGATMTALGTLLSESSFAFRGRVLALYSAVTYLGGVTLGAALMGQLYSSSGFTAVSYLCAGVTAVGVVLAASGGHRTIRETLRETEGTSSSVT